MRRYLVVGAACCAFACSAEESERGPAWQSASLLPPMDGPRLVVTNSGDDTLSFVDPVSFVEIARTPVGSSPVELEAAHHVAVSEDGRSLFVGLANTVQSNAQASGPHGNHGTGAADGYLLKIDALTGRQVGRIRVERSPGDVRRQPGTSRIWQSHYDLVTIAEVLEEGGAFEETWSSVIVTDGDTMERIARVEVCPAGHGIGFAPDGSEAYVSCGWSDELAVIDTTDFSVRRIPVAEDAGELTQSRYEPYALTVAPDGKVWVSNGHFIPNLRDNRGIRVIDPAAGLVIEELSIDMEGTPLFGSFKADGSLFFVVEQAPDRLHAIDPATADIVRTLELAPLGCINAHVSLLSPDETELWVVCEGDRVANPGTLERVDAESFEHTGHVEVGIFPDDVAFVPEVR